MPLKYTVTITSVGKSSVIVLPKPVLEGFNLKKGQRLEMIIRDDGIYIPLSQLNDDNINK
jgi:bifunctional DNA-binding transcriptional regulator/antitoxin component of YhaV-PrlF toxin-antitoxin module